METWDPNQLEDFRLWERWKKNQTKRELRPLLRRLDPLVETKMKPFRSVQLIPPSALKAEFQKHAIDAIEKYDPEYGVPLGHHVMRQMDGAKRWVYNYQNFGRLPDHRARKVGAFQHAFADLQRTLKRPPNSHELADRMRWPTAEVDRMTSELRQDLLPWKGSGAHEAMEIRPPKEREVLELIPYDLSPGQHAVFEYVYGLGGKPKLGTGQIAKVLNVSASKVSKVKAEIADVMRPHLE